MTELIPKEQRQQIGRYVRLLADELGLKDWVFTVDSQFPEDGLWADIWIPECRQWARLRCNPDLMKLRHDRLRYTLVHEMLHALFTPLDYVLSDKHLEELLGKPAHVIAVAAYDRAEEFLLDRLAEVIAPSMPMPHWDEPPSPTDEDDVEVWPTKWNRQ